MGASWGAARNKGPTPGMEMPPRAKQNASNKIPADSWDEECWSVAPTETLSSVDSIRHLSSQKFYDTDGGDEQVDPSRSFAFKWCGMDMVVDRRTVYLLVGLPLALLVLVLLGMLTPFITMLNKANVSDLRIKECALRRLWIGTDGRMNAEVHILTRVHNQEHFDVRIHGGEVNLFYLADGHEGVAVGKTVIDRQLLPKRPGSIVLEHVLAVHDLKGMRDGLGDRLFHEVLGKGNSTFHLAGHLPIYVRAGPGTWLPATQHVNCVFKQTWGRPLGDGATVCQNKLHLHQ